MAIRKKKATTASSEWSPEEVRFFKLLSFLADRRLILATATKEVTMTGAYGEQYTCSVGGNMIPFFDATFNDRYNTRGKLSRADVAGNFVITRRAR